MSKASRETPPSDSSHRGQGSIWAPAIATVITALVTFGGTEYFHWVAAQPALRGRVVELVFGQRTAPDGRRTTMLTTFLIVSNARDIPVPVIDYKLRVVFKNGADRTFAPAYSLSKRVTMTFLNGAVDMPDSMELLHKVRTLVTPQSPLSGFIAFEADSALWYTMKNTAPVKSIEVRLSDGFGGYHWIRTKEEDLCDPGLAPYFIPAARFTPTAPDSR